MPKSKRTNKTKITKSTNKMTDEEFIKSLCPLCLNAKITMVNNKTYPVYQFLNYIIIPCPRCK